MCGAQVWLEPSLPAGDAPCPHCGQLLWFFRTASGVQLWEHEEAAAVREKLIALIAESLGVDPEQVRLDRPFINDLGADSLDTVELIMELEEELGLDLGGEEFPQDE